LSKDVRPKAETKTQDKSVGFIDKIKQWSQTKSFNPIVIGSPSWSLRLHALFVTSPLVDYFDHMALFDDYSEKNLLILIGPLSEIQKEKCLKIKETMQKSYKTLYIEMPFELGVNVEERSKEVIEELSFLNIDQILIESFISLDKMADVIRKL
jgi:hypothetical protein